MQRKLITGISLCMIVIIAIYFRTLGINWDQGHLLHPDERFLLMVVSSMTLPNNFMEYFDTARSSLNPHNIGYGFYVYGTWPLVLLKFVATLLNLQNLSSLTILGRSLSTAADVATVLVVFLISRHISNTKAALFSSLAYALSVLPIQQSHFFTVDSFLCLLITMSHYFILKHSTHNKTIYLFCFFITFSAAVATKVSALYYLPSIMLYLIWYAFISHGKPILKKVFNILIASTLSLVVLLVMYPYLFKPASISTLFINDRVINNWKELSNLYDISKYKKDPSYIFPPAVYFMSVTKFFTPLQNFFIWGLGIHVVIILSVVITMCFIRKAIDKKDIKHGAILILGTLCFMLIQSGQNINYIRYFYPTIPAIIILLFWFASKLSNTVYKTIAVITITASFVHTSMFSRIYSVPHTRISASQWIYKNIPNGSSLGFEHWDDPLPLNMGADNVSSQYKLIEIPVFSSKSDVEFESIYQKIESVDYFILSSNRGYGAITGIKDIYPYTSQFYQDLFSDRERFRLIKSFVSRPGVYIQGISICIGNPFDYYSRVSETKSSCKENTIDLVTDYADESFTVYDHPKVFIFKNIQKKYD